jgi:hypothetical protein
MPHLTNDLLAETQERISRSIRECYNEVVTSNATGFVKFEAFNLMFVLTVNPKTSRFQASLVKLSDCRFTEDGPIEIPVEPVYAASFDFLEGMNSRLNDSLLTTENEGAVRFVNEELGRIFDKLMSILLGQLEKA